MAGKSVIKSDQDLYVTGEDEARRNAQVISWKGLLLPISLVREPSYAIVELSGCGRVTGEADSNQLA